MTKKTFQTDYEKYLDWVVEELEYENKELKKEDWRAKCFELTAKVVKLQIEIWWLMWERDWLKMVVDKLHKEIETQDLRLDNKEKLNKGYRKKLDKYKKYYDRDKEELMESCYSLSKENDFLKKKIEEDVEYWKGKYNDQKTCMEDYDKSLKEKNKKITELEETLFHRDSFFSLAWDLLANENIPDSEVVRIFTKIVEIII